MPKRKHVAELLFTLAFALVFALVFALAGVLRLRSANATIVMHAPVAKMAAESDVIVLAQVGRQQVEWSDDGQRIVTLTTLEIVECLKGTLHAGEGATIYQVGGSLDGRTFEIPGASKFEFGEEIVLFAMRFDDKLVSYGMGLGKFAIVPTAAGKTIAPEYGDVSFVERTVFGTLRPIPIPSQAAEPLAVFLARLRRLLAEPGVGHRQSGDHP